jgi:lysophospholipase
MERTSQCERCFERYCWDGTQVEDVIVGPPGGTWEETDDKWANDLEMVLEPGISWVEWNATHQY